MAEAFLPYSGEAAQLDGLINVWAEYRFHLATAIMAVVNKAIVLDDVIEAQFSGYTVKIPDWGDIAEDPDERAYSDAALMTWTHNGGFVGEEIVAWYVADSGYTKLLFIRPYLAPIVMNASGHQIKLLPRILLGDLAPP